MLQPYITTLNIFICSQRTSATRRFFAVIPIRVNTKIITVTVLELAKMLINLDKIKAVTIYLKLNAYSMFPLTTVKYFFFLFFTYAHLLQFFKYLVWLAHNYIFYNVCFSCGLNMCLKQQPIPPTSVIEIFQPKLFIYYFFIYFLEILHLQHTHMSQI